MDNKHTNELEQYEFNLDYFNFSSDDIRSYFKNSDRFSGEVIPITSLSNDINKTKEILNEKKGLFSKKYVIDPQSEVIELSNPKGSSPGSVSKENIGVITDFFDEKEFLFCIDKSCFFKKYALITTQTNQNYNSYCFHKINYDSNFESIIYSVFRLRDTFQGLITSRISYLIAYKEFQKTQETFFQSFKAKYDKDNNGEVDVIECDDFFALLEKHQKDVQNRESQYGKEYTQNFIRLSGYIKKKKESIQLLFNLITDTKLIDKNPITIKKATSDKDVFGEVFGDVFGEVFNPTRAIGPDIGSIEKNTQILLHHLEDEIHIYNIITLGGLLMISSLVEDEKITFYELYEKYDKINLWNSNWENEVSERLRDIKEGLDQLLDEMIKTRFAIVGAIAELTKVTEKQTELLSSKLDGINSKLNLNNLINTVQSYQLHKINQK